MRRRRLQLASRRAGLIGMMGALLIGMQTAPAAHNQGIVRTELQATISKSQQFILHSKAAKKDFLIQVAEPLRPPKPGEKLPVVYILDGDITFGLAVDVSRALQIVGEMTPAYIVGIAYPGGDLNHWSEARLFDMNYSSVEVYGQRAGGGGAAFENFLVSELRPILEARYAMDTNRTVLAGHSLGGKFATSILTAKPRAFSGYIIGSPALWMEPALLDRADSIKAGPGPDITVYVGAGSRETDEDLVGMAARLGQKLGKAPGFKARHKTFDGETHITVWGSLLANGLNFLLPGPTQ